MLEAFFPKLAAEGVIRKLLRPEPAGQQADHDTAQYADQDVLRPAT